MEVRAQIKFVHISPTKLRFLVDDVKTMSPQVALDSLQLSQQRSAKVLYKAIKSAVANGQGIAGFDPSKARFKKLSIDEGPVFKRFRPGARGMARPYVRKTAHITVVLEQKTVGSSKQSSNVAKKQKAKPESKQPSKEANKQVSKETSKQRSKVASKQGGKAPKAVKPSRTRVSTKKTKVTNKKPAK